MTFVCPNSGGQGSVAGWNGYPSPVLFPSPTLYPGANVSISSSGGLIDYSPIEITTFTEGILASYKAWINEDSANYLSALGSMFETVWGIVSDQGDQDNPQTYRPGWSVLLDVCNCPTEFLPFLSQFNGTDVLPGADSDTARSQIVAEAAIHRGTLSAMEQAALRYLIGDQHLIMKERADGDAYRMVVEFRPAECPDPQQLIDAVEAQKPAGIQITYLATSGYTWNVAEHTWSEDTMSWSETSDELP